MNPIALYELEKHGKSYYLVNGEKFFSSSHEVANYIADRIDTEDLDEYLDQKYGEVEIAGGFYDASRALKMVDCVAYQDAFDRLKHNEYKYVKNELDARAGKSFEITFHGVEVGAISRA